jgi:hypothetical protein
MSASDEHSGVITEVEIGTFAVSAFSSLRRLHQELSQYQSLLQPDGQRLLGYAQAVLEARYVDMLTLKNALQSLTSWADGGFNDYHYVFDQVQQAKRVLGLRVQGDVENTVLRQGERGDIRVVLVKEIVGE